MKYAKSVGTFAAGLSIAFMRHIGNRPCLRRARDRRQSVPARSSSITLPPAGPPSTTSRTCPGSSCRPASAAQLSSQWDYITQALCADYIEGQAAQMLQDNGGYTMKAGSFNCALKTNGALQVSVLSPGEVRLSWVTQGDSISLKVNAFTSPNIAGTFTASLDVDLNVAGSLTANDGDPSGSPFTLSSESLSFDNAQFTGSSLVPKNALQGVDNQVDTMTVDPLTLSTPPSFGQLLGSTNAFSHQVAAAVFNTYLGVGASETFAVSPAVDNDVLVLTLARDGSAPSAPPSGCSISEYALDFEATCNSQQPAGVSEITIMETHLGALGDADAYQNGNWTVVNPNGQPYADINAWEFPSTYSTLSLAACSMNEWGYTCAPSDGVPQPQRPVERPTTP